MKVWLFYIASKEVDNLPFDTEDREKKELYALTNSKKLAKGFKDTRNMEKFVLRKHEMEKNDYSRLANDNRECVLEWSKIKSKKENPYPETPSESFGKCVDEYTFPITFLEKQSMLEACDTFFEHCSLRLPSPYLFKWDLKLFMKRFGFEYIYKLKNFPFIGGDNMLPDSVDLSGELIGEKKQDLTYVERRFLQEDMDFSMPEIWVDQLEVFLHLYHHLMNL